MTLSTGRVRLNEIFRRRSIFPRLHLADLRTHAAKLGGYHVAASEIVIFERQTKFRQTWYFGSLINMQAAIRLLRRFGGNQSGSYVTVSALLMPVLVGAAGLGTEIGWWLYKHKDMQSAADSGAVSAATAGTNLSLPSSTFAYSAAGCGNQVSAGYSFQIPNIFGLGPISLTTQACSPN